MLKVSRIQASYDDVPALHDISFKVEEGRLDEVFRMITMAGSEDNHV